MRTERTVRTKFHSENCVRHALRTQQTARMKGVRMAAKLLLFTVLLLSFAELSVSVLIQLPGFPDPNTDVLFNMQTRRMEETIFLAQETSHVLVEPYYLFGARNWTWYPPTCSFMANLVPK